MLARFHFVFFHSEMNKKFMKVFTKKRDLMIVYKKTDE